MFSSEFEIFPTKITSLTDIRQISQLIQELDTYQQDDIEFGINKAICSVRSTIGKLTTYEEGKYSQGFSIGYSLSCANLKILRFQRTTVDIMF